MFTTLTIIVCSLGALYAHLKLEEWQAGRFEGVLVQLVPLLVIAVLAGLAAGVAVWTIQKSARRGRELQAANRELEQMNQRIKLGAASALISDQPPACAVRL